MVNFVMMVGLPASGKSTCAKKIAQSYNATIFSSDELRKEMFGDINDQSHNQELFSELHKRIKECLSSGKSAIYDACNISYKRRMNFLQSLNKIECKKICVIMATTYEECLKHNSERERKVPKGVIKRMYMNFNVPYWYEGWDRVEIEYTNIEFRAKYKPFDWAKSMCEYNQHNSHHSLSLGEHCIKAYEHICDCIFKGGDIELETATLIHDCGKPDCATFVNSKGEVTEECHYYNHQFAGAYKSLFFSGLHDQLYVAQLIQWHMNPYMAWRQSEKAMNRDRKLLGEKLFNDIMTLHEADVNAH